MSSVDQKEYIRLVGIEGSFKEFKSRAEDDMKDLKMKLEDEQKASSDLRCDVLKLQSELKTLDMNLTMKDDMIKRTKVNFYFWFLTDRSLEIFYSL